MSNKQFLKIILKGNIWILEFRMKFAIEGRKCHLIFKDVRSLHAYLMIFVSILKSIKFSFKSREKHLNEDVTLHFIIIYDFLAINHNANILQRNIHIISSFCNV